MLNLTLHYKNHCKRKQVKVPLNNIVPPSFISRTVFNDLLLLCNCIYFFSLYIVLIQVDFIFASFVYDPVIVEDIRGLLGNKAKTMKIISKIENYEGIRRYL